MARHRAPGESVTMASTSSAGNMKVGAGAGTERLGNEAIGKSVTMAVESTTVDGVAAN